MCNTTTATAVATATIQENHRLRQNEAPTPARSLLSVLSAPPTSNLLNPDTAAKSSLKTAGTPPLVGKAAVSEVHDVAFEAADADRTAVPAETLPTSKYRIKSVSIKRGDAIDQITFKYTDGTKWANGHDGGKADNRVLTLAAGEHLVKVVHEKFLNHKCAGAAVTFYTNKGRVFAYEPHLTTKWQSEQMVAAAEPGHELVSLKIQRGVLVGFTQQPAPIAEPRAPAAPRPSWFALGMLWMKEEPMSDAAIEPVDRFVHFTSRAAADAAWLEAVSTAKAKQGRAAILIDCMNLELLKSIGTDAIALEALKGNATTAGLLAPKRDEDVSIVDACGALLKILSASEERYSDLARFIFVMGLLAISFYFDLEGKMLTGSVLAIFSGGGGTNGTVSANSAVASGLDPSLASSRYVQWAGAVLGESTDPRKTLIVAFALVTMLERGFYVLNVYFHHYACARKNHQLRMKAFTHVMSLDQSFFDTHSQSEIMGSMKVSALNDMITWNIPYIITLILKCVMSAYYMLSIDATIASLSIGGMLGIKYGILNPCEQYEKKCHNVTRKINTLNMQIVSEALGMITSVKLFSKEQYHADEHDEAQLRFANTINATVSLRVFREFMYGLFKTLVFCGVLYFAIGRIESMEPNALTGFFLMNRSFMDLFGRIKWHWERLVHDFADVDRFLQLMATESVLKAGTSTFSEPIRGEIEFKGVKFSYPSRPGEQVIKGLDLKIQANKKTAIVGGSGAGKSTIAKLLLRLYDPNEGVVTLDGQDISNVVPTELHKYVGIVSQSPELFQGSLYDNIAYGKPDNTATEAEVKAAALRANCGFIDKFRAGYDTFAGSHGTQLSGGQKQRIAIARAAIRKSAVMVLDEATSALDAENEKQVQQALDSVMEGQTVVVIAHRLSTIRNADDVICMEDGAVAERGTHDELMEKNGVYAKLVRMQLIEEEGDTTTITTETSI